MNSKLNALLKRATDAGDVPGVAAALTNRKETTHEAAFGRRVLGESAAMDLDTVMWIASMTKPIVGTAAMQLVEQGRMALDEPAASVVPELATFRVLEGWGDKGEPRLRAPKSPITLRHLLTHTSGFTYDIWNADMARYCAEKKLPRAGSGRRIALQTPLSFDPGERWEYGIGIDWAARMVEAASGLRLGEYLQRNVTGPLGMASTAFRITPAMRARKAKVHQRGADGGLTVTDIEVEQNPELDNGGGGLYSTANDYLRFVRMVMNGGTGNGNRVLRAETVALMSRNAMGSLRVRRMPTMNPALTLETEFFPGTPKSWGLTFMINEQIAPTGRTAGSLAWAGLPNTFFWIDPAKDIAGVVMMQVLPFLDPKSLALFTAYERAVYASMRNSSDRVGGDDK